MKLRLALLASFVFALLSVQSALARSPQDQSPFGDVVTRRNCATPEPSALEMEHLRTAVRRYVEEHGIKAVGGQIKVAFHVIYSGNEGNVPQSQIDAQIDELNRGFSGHEGGVRTGYTFVLASVDRTNNKRWFRMLPGTGQETQAKNALAIDPAHRLNIYTCKPGQGYLGWATFPWFYPESSKLHGVVIHYGSLPGGNIPDFNLGDTATHEVGHYLGLFHTFQGGCGAPGDEVADTPPEGTATSGCPNNKDTCAGDGLDPIHNYMDYSDDACYTEFTAGQDARMDNLVPTYRPSLLDASAPHAIVTPVPDAANMVFSGGVMFRGAFPNPFSDQTTFRWSLPRTAEVSLRVYNVAGQLVQSLVESRLPEGDHSALFRAENLPPGMYFATLRVDGVQSNRTVVLVH